MPALTNAQSRDGKVGEGRAPPANYAQNKLFEFKITHKTNVFFE